jgi:hypothetical protein
MRHSRGAKKRLMETDHPSRMVILSPPQAEEPKDLSSDQIRKPKITPGTWAKKKLMETYSNSELELSIWSFRHLRILIETKTHFLPLLPTAGLKT